MDFWPLVFSNVCFLAAFAHTMFALGAGRHRSSRGNLGLMLAGFALQFWYLWQRGAATGRCPLATPGDLLVFLAWATVLLYLLIGPPYRLSLLGAFTAPLVVVLQTVALARSPTAPPPKGMANAWVEWHAATTIVAYGAFALAGVAGAMLLAQEWQLKRHALRPLFFHLPALADLAGAIRRLLLAGFALLTAGLAAGFVAGQPGLKTGLGTLVWAVYAAILVRGRRGRASGRATALMAVIGCAIALASLLGIGWALGGRP